MRHAIEEYKTALNADPNSSELNDELADLYFRTGQVRDAEAPRAACSRLHPTTLTRIVCWAASICAS